MNQQSYRQWCLLDGIKNGYTPIAEVLDSTKIQWVIKPKNDDFQKTLLKKIAKEHELIIWLQEIYNGNENYRILTVLGFSSKQKKLEHIPLEQMFKIFGQQNDTPMLVKLGKLFVFNKHGMHQRKDVDDCELCLTQNQSQFPILNCCGKSACDSCKKYYPGNICPFCKQTEINLQLIVLPQNWQKMIREQ